MASEEFAKQAKQEFVIEDPELCYLDGNSLGRLPKATATRIANVVEQQWGKDLIGGWNQGWIDLPQKLGEKLSQIVGARSTEVLVSDSTSLNLFKLATAGLRLQAPRKKILTEASNFPSDLYILESASEATGLNHQIQTVGVATSTELPTQELLDALDADTAMVCLSHVAFRSGALWDIELITRAAHEAGALVLWDLSHSVGAVPVELAKHQVDLAVGCTYKYLCGGPGAPAFLYVREDLQNRLQNPIQGWFAHESPFEFRPEFEPAQGLKRFQVGTPPILSMSAIEAGVDLVLNAGVENLRFRSTELSQLLLEQFDRRLAPLGYQLRTPRNPHARGSHVSLGHPEARRITACLIQKHKVVPDFREPDNIRLGIAPLYTTEADIAKAIQALERIVLHNEYLAFQIDNGQVT